MIRHLILSAMPVMVLLSTSLVLADSQSLPPEGTVFVGVADYFKGDDQQSCPDARFEICYPSCPDIYGRITNCPALGNPNFPTPEFCAKNNECSSECAFIDNGVHCSYLHHATELMYSFVGELSDI